jgi:hypothetical protein
VVQKILMNLGKNNVYKRKCLCVRKRFHVFKKHILEKIYIHTQKLNIFFEKSKKQKRKMERKM